MVDRRPLVSNSTYEIDEFNEITASGHRPISYNSLISYSLDNQQSAPAVATRMHGRCHRHRHVPPQADHITPMPPVPIALDEFNEINESCPAASGVNSSNSLISYRDGVMSERVEVAAGGRW